MDKGGISKVYFKATKALYRRSCSVINVGNTSSGPFSPTKGLEQVYCLS